MKFEETKDRVKRQYPVTMTFRCTTEDRDTIRRRASETGNSLSTFLRKRATGGRTNQPIQDSRDIAQLKQCLGLLKQLVSKNGAVRPVLQALETLIIKMTAKAG